MELKDINPADTDGAIFRQNSTKDYYFWDETWTSCKGPYRTKEVAKAALLLYAEFEVDGQTRLPKWIQ